MDVLNDKVFQEDAEAVDEGANCLGDQVSELGGEKRLAAQEAPPHSQMNARLSGGKREPTAHFMSAQRAIRVPEPGEEGWGGNFCVPESSYAQSAAEEPLSSDDEY
jgi:hypothetical protein